MDPGKNPFAALKAAAIDGRTRNVFYRQTQLSKLHHRLVQESPAITSAIVTDTGCSGTEAQVEYSLALTELRRHFAELVPKEELEEEYAIANGKDCGGRRLGYGLVLINAQWRHSPFFSVIAPLSAAIAAGNCVGLLLENNLRSLSTYLRELLKNTLDNDTFEVSTPSSSHPVVSDECLHVLQDHQSMTPGSNQLVSATRFLTVAVVDRTSDIDRAARALVHARFAFKGRSPYAPDLVLVNEFVRKDFMQAAAGYSISIGEGMDTTLADKPKSQDNDGLQKLVAELQRNTHVRVIAQEAKSAILHMTQSSPVRLEKVKERCLIVQDVKSLDDAIDLLNHHHESHLAAYHWGEPAQCNYLSQFIDAHVSFANHIPAELLVGPAFPLGHEIDPSVRYQTKSFSRPAPAFAGFPSTSTLVEKAFLADTQSEKGAAVQAIKQDAISTLPAKDRKQPLRAHFGFFEQAMLVNLGFVLVSTTTLVSGGWYLLKHVRSFW